MENKYYTPGVEEFHVGFEYELQADDELWYWSNVWQDIILKCIEGGRCRVKHLDREDIESLGFTQCKKDKDWFDYEGEQYWMYLEDGRWSICDEDSTVGFQGTIKNKSELKRLLKQLNIK